MSCRQNYCVGLLVRCLKEADAGLPLWLSGKESTCHAGDMGLIPGPGRSHMPWSNSGCEPQLWSPSPETQGLQLLSPCPRARALHTSNHCTEKPRGRNSSSPLAPKLEKSLCSSGEAAQPKQYFFSSKERNSGLDRGDSSRSGELWPILDVCWRWN